MTQNDQARAGLCATCRHARRIDTCRGPVYWMCRRSETESKFVKYPRLPVSACPGFETGPGENMKHET